MAYTYTNPRILYHGKRIDILSIEAPHPKGGVTQKEVVSHPGAVVILPLLDPEHVVMIRNERAVVQETLWELPAGTLEKNEDHAICALRELEEETGYKAGSITHLFDVYSTPGFCNEKLYIYLAEDLHHVGQALDETEKIDVHPMKLEQAFEMILDHTIRDAKTLCTLLYLRLQLDTQIQKQRKNTR